MKKDDALRSAHALMEEYSQATGASFSIQDTNFTPIPEVLDNLLSEKNICLFCIKYKNHIDAKSVEDFSSTPCKEMHINAVKESQRQGTAYTYTCPLGFIYWISSICPNGRFAGSLLGGGFLQTSMQETCERMYSVCEGAVEMPELMRLIKGFPNGKPQKIKALAELLSYCARILSPGREDHDEVVKRRSIQQSELEANIEELKISFPQGSPKPEYPMEKEQKLLEVLRAGDAEAGKKLLGEILAILIFTNPGEFKQVQYRAIELIVLLSRVNISSVFTYSTMHENNGLVLKMIQEAKNIEELTDIMYRIVDDLASQIRSFQGLQHAMALKRAEDYIMRNLARKISLEEIAKISGFSPPYFSSIFKEEMGENFTSFLNRIRVEKASALLTGTHLSLNKIGRSCGFEDQSWFSKTFKNYTGISPGKFRSRGEKSLSKIPETGFSEDYLREISPGDK